jgi:carbamoyltransferase
VTAILGISAFYHDSAAAHVVDGKVVAAAQEERFSREKHDESFPVRAIESCLAQAGLSPEQLDYVGFYDKPYQKFDRLLETYLAYAPAGFRSFAKALPVWTKRKLHLPREMSRGLRQAYGKRYVFAEHHESHAASAFFPSPFDEAAILTLDGVGEWATASFGTGRGHRVGTIDNSAAYVASWLERLRKDAKLVVVAAAQAQRAADFILARQQGEESEVAP